MNLNTNDLHVIFDDTTNRLSVWNARHALVFRVEARNATVADGQFGHFGNCPRGQFIVGTPVRKDTVPFGHWFTPLQDYTGHDEMEAHGRGGIGFHGGGTGLRQPFAPAQGWVRTEGCVRLQNWANDALVGLVQKAHAGRGVVYFTVTGEN